MNKAFFSTLLTLLSIMPLTGNSQTVASACAMPWRADSTYPGGSDQWLLSLPAIGKSVAGTCKLSFDSPGYLSRVICFNGSGMGDMRDHATATLSNPSGWQATVSSSCDLSVTIPFKKAGNVRVTATLSGNFMSGTYYSTNHPEGVAFNGERVVPLR